MAPQRRAKVVVSSTRKIVQAEGDDDSGNQQQSVTVPFEDIAEDIITEICLEVLSNDDKARKEPQTVAIPVEAPETKQVQKQKQVKE